MTMPFSCWRTVPMIRYKDWSPTQFDSKGLNLPDQQDWFVAPVMQTRHSGPLDKSNFEAAHQLLCKAARRPFSAIEEEEEQDRIEIHRFGHWGPRWIEILLVHPSLEDTVQELEECLENYPVLDEEDYSRREQEEYQEGWNSYGYKDFIRAMQKAFCFSDSVKDMMEDASLEELQEFYESCIPSGEYYSGDDVCINIRSAVQNCTRDDLCAFVRKLRNKKEVQK